MSPPGLPSRPIRPLTWSPVTESNRRPSPYHGDALPTELTGPIFTCPTCGFAVFRRARRSCTALVECLIRPGEGRFHVPTQESLPCSCRGGDGIWGRLTCRAGPSGSGPGQAAPFAGEPPEYGQQGGGAQR